ncbi:MAG: hypothetical protein M1476_06705 [Candidatus Thermoplasmatota archaeon]|nr:hypothetical protein [Candidatus Thermoplasmatota archaeon]
MKEKPPLENKEDNNRSFGSYCTGKDEDTITDIVSRIQIPRYRTTLKSFGEFCKKFIDEDTRRAVFSARVNGDYLIFDSVDSMLKDIKVKDRLTHDELGNILFIPLYNFNMFNVFNGNKVFPGNV